MSLGSYPDFQNFPRVGVFEGFFLASVLILRLFAVFHACFFEFIHFRVHYCYTVFREQCEPWFQSSGSTLLGCYCSLASCFANYIVNIFIPNKVWTMVVRTHADRIQYAPCILLCLVLFDRNMPSIYNEEMQFQFPSRVKTNPMSASISLQGNYDLKNVSLNRKFFTCVIILDYSNPVQRPERVN